MGREGGRDLFGEDFTVNGRMAAVERPRHNNASRQGGREGGSAPGGEGGREGGRAPGGERGREGGRAPGGERGREGGRETFSAKALRSAASVAFRVSIVPLIPALSDR